MIVPKTYITEMDLLRLQKALLMCRMAANSTFLVDKEPPGYSSKLDDLDELFDQLVDETDRKIVLFSEWTTMLDLIEPLLTKRKLDLRAARRLGAAEEAAGIGHRFPERTRVAGCSSPPTPARRA